MGGHAIAVVADSKHNCHIYATSALQGLLGDASAIRFFATSSAAGAQIQPWAEPVSHLQAMQAAAKSTTVQSGFQKQAQDMKTALVYIGCFCRADGLMPTRVEPFACTYRWPAEQPMHKSHTASINGMSPQATRYHSLCSLRPVLRLMLHITISACHHSRGWQSFQQKAAACPRRSVCVASQFMSFSINTLTALSAWSGDKASPTCAAQRQSHIHSLAEESVPVSTRQCILRQAFNEASL